LLSIENEVSESYGKETFTGKYVFSRQPEVRGGYSKVNGGSGAVCGWGL